MTFLLIFGAIILLIIGVNLLKVSFSTMMMSFIHFDKTTYQLLTLIFLVLGVVCVTGAIMMFPFHIVM